MSVHVANLFLLLLLFVVPLLLDLIALLHLRQRAMQDVARVLWVAVILLVPILGAIAYFITTTKRGTGDTSG